MKALVLVFLVACGGGWTAADTKSAAGAARAEIMIDELCRGDGACNAAQVRALDRAATCANASQLARHGAPVPDAGFSCLP